MNINLRVRYASILELTILVLILYPDMVSSECTCEVEEGADQDKREAALVKYYKLASIACILVAGGIGVSLPLLGKKISALSPENDVFFMIKAFGGGVILSTGFVHILPEGFDTLTSPCLGENPWGHFPFTGLIAMISGIGTLMIDSLATGFYKRNKQVNFDDEDDEDISDEHSGQGHVHVHVHSHASVSPATRGSSSSELIRHRIIAQVLELGIVVHSVIIGISVGAAQSSKTVKPLLVALSFHQFFEGMALGGCISQAKLRSKSTAMMAIFFSLTTPVGIAIGMGISSSVYKDNNRPTALAVEGIFNSASAGILIYMALVDILAADFINPKLLSNFRILLASNASLLLGAASTSLLAIWV